MDRLHRRTDSVGIQDFRKAQFGYFKALRQEEIYWKQRSRKLWPSYIWSSILAAKSILKDGCRLRVGNGSSIRIWHDPWLLNPRQGFVTSEPSPGREDAIVDQLILAGENSWDYNLLADLFNEEDRGQIMKIPLIAHGREDRMFWIHDKKGAYSVRSGYKLLMANSFTHSHNTIESFWNKIWRYKIPAKVRNLIWKASLNVLPTTDQLRAKRVDVDSHCPVCLTHEESVLHVFVSCELAQKVWETVGIASSPRLVANFQDWLTTTLKNHQQDQEIIAMLCWAIWMNRNETVWNAKSFTVRLIETNLISGFILRVVVSGSCGSCVGRRFREYGNRSGGGCGFGGDFWFGGGA
ncbi:unnamed protein product [Fraxinus pennsylvanica]|uniref:Reverse transcriptase zinc-binding domain-containing protein n=1 Tax=Fraxinus pennsylvanica TaxID=56036 RepID=A0AAD2AFK7_9LAMI|nr:unnamed protein product [Fraxinus pennsylvanica]